MAIIKIFDENDRDFSSNGNIAINPKKCKETKKKSLNGWYIEVECDVRYKEYIEQDKLCVVKTKSKLNPQAFRINNINIEGRTISFTANHVMFDSEKYFLVDVRPTNQNGQNALSYINERTDKTSPFSIYSDVGTQNTAYFIRKNLLEAWAVIEERWGGIFDADNWQISFRKKVGNDNGECVIYGKNMQGMKVFEDWSAVCTRIYPVGSNELLLDEKYIDSDIQYPMPYTRTISFTSDLEAEEGEEIPEEELKKELKEKAEKYLEKNKYPQVSYEVTSNINQNMEIGDIIHVKHPLVDLITEVLEYEHNILTGKIETLVFGNYTRDVKSKFDGIQDSIQDMTDLLFEGITRQDIVIQQQTDLINSLNKNGYVYIDENEILILDALPKENAKNVWRFGLGGIGFSSNGYEGPFEIAMTMDGQINAKFITTGTMSTARIEGLQNALNGFLVSIQLNSDNIQNLVEKQSKDNEDLKSLITQKADSITSEVNKKLESYDTSEEVDSKIEQKAGSITSTVNETIEKATQQAIDSANSSTDEKLKKYSTTTQMNSAITQKADSITNEVNKKLESYDTSEEVDSKIEQKAGSITSSVNETIEGAKQEAIDSANSSTDEKLKQYSTTTQMNSAITQKADSITSSVNAKFGNYYTKTETNSQITQNNSTIMTEVNKKVNNSEFGTKLQQSAYDIQIAWNNISQYIQFINASLRIMDSSNRKLLQLDRYGLYLYDTDGSTNKMILDRQGQKFYEGGEYVGLIGTNSLQGYSTKKSLSFNLDTNGSYMTWACKDNAGDSIYAMKLWYARPNTGSLQQGLALGSELYMNGRDIIVGSGVRLTKWSNTAGFKVYDKFTFSDGGSSICFELDTINSIMNIYRKIDMHGYNITNAGNVASDGRMKKLIYPSKINAIDRIKQISHRQFKWKKDDKQEEIGYIAQEMEKIDKNYVRHNYAEDEEGNITEDTYEMRVLPVLATATKAIQEQQEIIEGLEKKINILMEKLNIQQDLPPEEENFIEEPEVIFDGSIVNKDIEILEEEPKYRTLMKDLGNGEIEIFKELDKESEGENGGD